MKPTTYLLTATILIVATARAQAADPLLFPVQPRVIYPTPPAEIVMAPVMVEPGVPNLIVELGPYYSGPAIVDFPKPIFHEDRPIRAYPYVRTWEAAHAYVPEPIYRRPVRVLRYGPPLRRSDG